MSPKSRMRLSTTQRQRRPLPSTKEDRTSPDVVDADPDIERPTLDLFAKERISLLRHHQSKLGEALGIHRAEVASAIKRTFGVH
jgi:hypothetical protein